MDYKEILRWFSLALTVLTPKNVMAVYDSIQVIVNEVETLLAKLGINLSFGAADNVAMDDECTAIESQICAKLATASGDGRSAPDFARFRALLLKAKELGILDIIMAALVPKIPLSVNAAAAGADEMDGVNKK